MKDKRLLIVLGTVVGCTAVYSVMKPQHSVTPVQRAVAPAPTDNSQPIANAEPRAPVAATPATSPKPQPSMTTIPPKRSKPQPTVVKPGKSRQPDNHPGKLVFETKLMELYAEPNAGYIPATFRFTNKGDQSITITKTDTCSGCVVETLKKKTYRPGESGTLKTKFRRSHFQGTLKRVILLYTDEKEIKPYELELQLHVPVYVKTSPDEVRWRIGSKATPKTVEITSVYPGFPIKVTNVIQRGKGSFKAELITVAEGKRYTLRITPLDMSTRGFQRFFLTTDYPEKEPLQVKVTALVD